MAEIKSIEVERWSEPDEKRLVKRIGMRTVGEVFEELKAHLEQKGMLPDEYFELDFYLKRDKDRELPCYEFANCAADFGSSEGIYLDIVLEGDDENMPASMNFITGKTLREDVDAYYRMSRIAAECSLILNGRGTVYQQKCTELVLEPEQVQYLKSLLWREAETAGGKGMETGFEVLKKLA